MNIHMYQYFAKRLPEDVYGVRRFELSFFKATNDFIEFEMDMERIVPIKFLIIEFDLREMVGNIYDPEEGKLPPLPIEWWVNDNGRECCGIMLLNKYPVSIEFNDNWFRMFHIDDDCCDVKHMVHEFENDNDVQESLSYTIDSFNIALTVDFAMYSKSYDKRDKNSAVYY